MLKRYRHLASGILAFSLAFVMATYSGPSYGQKTKSQITTEINTLFPDNTVGAITPARLRQVTTDIVNSYGGLIDANSYNQLNKFWMNAASPPSALTGTVIQVGNIDATATRIELNSFGAQSFFSSVCYGGTNASKTALTTGTQCGGYNFHGYNGTSVVGPAATFRTFAAQNWSVGSQGSYAEVATTQNSTTTLTSRMRWENDGGVTVPPTVTGGSQGAGTLNASGLFVNGVAVATSSGGAGDLTRTNDTNVTLTLGGTPTGALFKSVSMTLGWSGTLGASRGGFGTDVSAASGVPLWAAGVPTFTSTTGTGNFVRATSPTIASPTFSGTVAGAGTIPNSVLVNSATTVNGQTCTLGSPCTVTAVASSFAMPVTVSGTASSGGIPYFNSTTQMSSSAALAANALVIGGGAGVAPSTTTTASGFLTWLGTPSSANLRSLLTDETGTGVAVFDTSPAITTPTITTPTFVTSTIYSGSSSGAVTLQTQAAAGTWNWNWPTTAGTAGQVLTSQGGGSTAMTWTTVAGTGTVTQVDTSTGLTGGPINTTGTISVTGVLADLVGQSWAQGDVIYYNGTNLVRLAPGTNGQLLQTQGAGANPQWATVAGSGTVTSVAAGTGMSFSTITGSGSVAIDKATASNFQAGTSNKVLTADIVFTSETTTTFGSTTSFDFSTFINTQVTLTGNITTMNVSNIKAGQAGTISFLQDGTGSRTTVWNSNFKFAGGTTPTLSTAAGARDVLTYACRTTSFCTANLLKDVK